MAALAGFTVVTGLVDAVSYLGLGHVFTANMTGNVVFLGFAFGGAKGFSVSASLFAMAGFLAGALAGGRLVPLGAAIRRARTAFALEGMALTVAAVVAGAVGTPQATTRSVLLVLLGSAMGLQNSAVRRLGVADMTTTVLTLTLTGIAADSRLAGGTDPHIVRRVGSVALMLAGAAVGAVLERHGRGWPVALSLVVVAGALAVLGAAPASGKAGPAAAPAGS